MFMKEWNCALVQVNRVYAYYSQELVIHFMNEMIYMYDLKPYLSIAIPKSVQQCIIGNILWFDLFSGWALSELTWENRLIADVVKL